jgi:hypothetical protein
VVLCILIKVMSMFVVTKQTELSLHFCWNTHYFFCELWGALRGEILMGGIYLKVRESKFLLPRLFSSTRGGTDCCPWIGWRGCTTGVVLALFLFLAFEKNEKREFDHEHFRRPRSR